MGKMWKAIFLPIIPVIFVIIMIFRMIADIETYLTSFARVFVSLLVAFSYPLQCHPARRCLITLITSIKQAYVPDEDKRALANGSPSSNQSDDNYDKESAAERILFNIITVRAYIACFVFEFVMFTQVGFLGLSFLLAISVADLGVLLSLVGATGSTIVSYILPGFLYYIHFDGEGPVWKRNLALIQGLPWPHNNANSPCFHICLNVVCCVSFNCGFVLYSLQ